MASSKQALWAAGHDETVEVNQRALIDKVLARYSGQFTVFRELLQNSDDAEARSVEIRFETGAYLSREIDDDLKSDKPEREDLRDLQTAVVHQWTFKNNGIPFRDQDWKRLKKIADGNPDEEKIGAFGVGFYSLFSVTDEPWVMSGGRWMNFYWKDKKDQLYVRRGTMPASVVDPWTTLQMTLREPSPIPPAFDLTRFLVSSITFMMHLSEVSVYFDDKRLVKLSKNCGMSKEVPMLKGLKGTSPQVKMKVKSIETMPLRIEAKVVRWVYNVGSEKPSTTSGIDSLNTATYQTSGFFSPQSDPFETSSTLAPMVPEEPINLFEATSSNIVLTIFAANVEVRLDKKMTGELLRSTLKKPPSRLRYELIYTGKEEYDSSVKAEEEAAHATGSVFQGLRADLEGTGSTRVFIGHSTAQTTGIGGHMAARFIPTVERESIDFVDRNVGVWNKELLYVGGFLARSVYEFELDAIKNLWNKAAAVNGSGGLPGEEDQKRLRGRALHALKFFTFHPSTPSRVVSNLMETAFFACATTHPFSFISSVGVRNLSQVHISKPELSGFLKRLPVIPEDIAKGAKVMIAVLRSRGMVKEITFVGVLNEIRSLPLSETETIACLQWWIGVSNQGNTQKHFEARSQLLDALVVSVTGPPKKLMKLSDARTFLNTKTSESIIPTDGPLPTTLLPSSITTAFERNVLTSEDFLAPGDAHASVFPWKPLLITDWLRYVTDPEVAASNAEFDVTKSTRWAERVLSVLARTLPLFTQTAKKDVIQILSRKPCVPTFSGLKVPNQAFFSTGDVDSLYSFRDLPVVSMPSGAVVEGALKKVLKLLGVRSHLQLKIILESMVETGYWTTFDLVKYLASVQSTLTNEEIDRLRRTSVFQKEGAGREQSTAGTSHKIQRYKAIDLYEPVDIFREIGLPVMDWGANNPWTPTSDEAKFVFSLGLGRAPPLPDILRIAASDDPTVRTKALMFFLQTLPRYYYDYDPYDFRDLAFIPAILGSEKIMVKPLDVYASPEWAELGFAVVDPTLHDKMARRLKVKKSPSTSNIVTVLKRSPPEDEATARRWFDILSGHVSDFSPAERRQLQEIPFVPVKSTGEKIIIKRLQPIQCFLGTASSELHSKLFVFVDFGARANAFLGACGSKQEPSVEDIAQILITEPRRVYELANGRENYLFELRNLAVNRRRLESGITSRMKGSNVLLGTRRVKKDGGKVLGGGNQDDSPLLDDLLQPNKVAIVDDTNAYRLFGHRIFCAPQEDILEELYLALGSPRLSSLVKECYRTSGEAPYSKIGAETRHLVLERLPLFLHGHSQLSPEVSLNWLQNEKNFIVKVFGKLLVTKSLHHGDICDSKSHEVSAVAKREGKGPIELWVAGNKQVNMYEISTSLCRIIFQSTKVKDALLFMTILSTDLKALKQRGYNVERVLPQQKVERQAAEKAERVNAGRERTEKANPEGAEKTKIPITQTNILLPSASTVIATPGSAGRGRSSTDSRQTSAIPKLGRLLRQNRSDATLSQLASPSTATSSREIVASPQLDPTITSLSNIANNIDMAIKACAPERSNLLGNRGEMQTVLESLDEGYCHVTRKTGDLELVGNMGDIKIFAAPDLPEPESLIQRKHDELARFIHVLKPLVELYKIPQTSLEVFADKEWQLICLNRGGRLVLNLGYFEAWHDCDVQRGDFNKALISWYFMLAHGIAHNLVYPHNLEHEFYFSAICEAHLEPLINLLSNSRQIMRQ